SRPAPAGSGRFMDPTSHAAFRGRAGRAVLRYFAGMTASPRWLGFLAGALLLGAAGGFVACREGATQDSPGTGGAGSHDGDGGAGASPEGLRVPGTSAYSCS